MACINSYGCMIPAVAGHIGELRIKSFIIVKSFLRKAYYDRDKQSFYGSLIKIHLFTPIVGMYVCLSVVGTDLK